MGAIFALTTHRMYPASCSCMEMQRQPSTTSWPPRCCFVSASRTELICQAGFIFVALAFYHLLKGVNQRHASLMVILLVVSVPIAFINELNAIAALVLVRGADFLSLFDEPQRDALAMLFLNLHGHGIDLAGIFWGLWLFPLGLLVYRAGFLPRILGVVLMANCFAYPVNRRPSSAASNAILWLNSSCSSRARCLRSSSWALIRRPLSS